MADTATYRAALMRRLRQLDTRSHAIENALDAPRARDWEEAATEREGDEVLERLGRTGEVEIARIRAALGRLRDGSYGICTGCGERIARAAGYSARDAALPPLRGARGVIRSQFCRAIGISV